MYSGRGRILRDLVWFSLGWLGLVLVLLVVQGLIFPAYSPARLWALATLMLFSEALALILARFPRGEAFVMLRLGGAAFCRTIVPLLLSLWFAWYSNQPLGRADVVPLLGLYGYGVILGTVFSVRNLGLEYPETGPGK